MSKNYRSLKQNLRNYPLKQRNSPISAVTANQWFADSSITNNVVFRGSGTRFFNYIKTLVPSLTDSQVYKIDASARYAAMLSGGNVSEIISRFLENSATTWDFRDYNYQKQDLLGSIPVNSINQNVSLIQPLSGNNNFTLQPSTFATFVPALSDETNGLYFRDFPYSGYVCSDQTPKTIILSHTPVNTSDSAVTYPFCLSTNLANVSDFHPDLNNGTRYFRSLAVAPLSTANIRLNNVSILFDNLQKQYLPHLLSIGVTNNGNLRFNCLSTDRVHINVLPPRRYSGNYRMLFTSNNLYTESQMIELNHFCMVYAGLI